MAEMKEILFSKEDQLSVYSDGTHYELEWVSWGHQIQENRKEIEKSDFEAYENKKRSGNDLIFKARNGVWPPTKEEKMEIDKKAIIESPTSLIDSPELRQLFTQEELQNLIPIAEQQWIDWKGKLPADYVSPLQITNFEKGKKSSHVVKVRSFHKNNKEGYFVGVTGVVASKQRRDGVARIRVKVKKGTKKPIVRLITDEKLKKLTPMAEQARKGLNGELPDD